MTIRNFTLFLVSSILLWGCSGGLGVMDGIMQSWHDVHIDEVVSQWGYPHEEREFRGRQLYIWHHNESAFISPTTTTTGSLNASTYGNMTTGTYSTTSTTTGGYVFNGSCDRILEVNEQGIVISSQWGGNNCPFMELMEYASWRRRLN